MKDMKKIFTIILWSIVVLLAIRLIDMGLSYFSFQSYFEFLVVKQDMLQNMICTAAFYLNLLGGALAVLTGSLAFMTNWFKPTSSAHKNIGK